MKKAPVLLIAFVIGAVFFDAYLIGVNVELGITVASTTITYGNSGVLSPAQQQQNAQGYGLNLSNPYFTCSTLSGCEKVQIAPCDNNVPSQFACINPSYYNEYYAQWKTKNRTAAICPEYYRIGNISCSCDLQSDTCIETDSAV